MDNTDKRILNLLRNDARMPNVALARELNMAPSAVLERVRKLEESGVIQGYVTRIDSRKLNRNMQILIDLDTDENIGESSVGLELAKMPEIVEILETCGERYYRLKVVVRDTDELADLMYRIGKIPLVRKSYSHLILNTIKNDLSSEIID
ncbi:MAG: Lrp/AsnC family transcriptional regulator [Lentisphaerae bacterium]|nr:Lrp/AsnC family transcriptional regulator [Lentisphaerota bacterium]